MNTEAPLPAPMTAVADRAGYDHFGYPVATSTGPVCGRCTVRHLDARAVRECYAIAKEQQETQEADARVEASYVRHLEDRCYDDARAQDAYEARNGVVGFTEAWHLASPETCPCPDHSEETP